MDVLKPVPMQGRIDDSCASEVVENDELRTKVTRESFGGASFKRPSNTVDLTESQVKLLKQTSLDMDADCCDIAVDI